MQQAEQTIVRDVVLVGGGHSHAVLLRMFAMNPIAGVRLTLICRDTHTPYSGMLPGYLAGHYQYDDVHIDLDRLATFAGARFLRDDVVGIDRQNRRVLCRNRPPVNYDLLSINIGSTPATGKTPGADQYSVPVKPINRFNDRWQAMLERVEASRSSMRIAIVGGGAGGVELMLAMHHRLTGDLRARGQTRQRLHFHLFTASAELLPTHNPSVRRYFSDTLRSRGIHVHVRSRVTAVDEAGLTLENGESHPADEVLWVTQAGGAGWLAKTGLELDDRGFIRVNEYLQSVNDPTIFAAGDVASLDHAPREKAGVFAVRMGRPLAENLRRKLFDEALRPYHPQKNWLALISTGDRHAVASRGRLFLHGALVWRWKNWIDRRFMAKFSEFPDMADMKPASGRSTQLALDSEEKQQAISAIAMRCGGCGAKVGTDVLGRALSELQPVESEDVLIGLHAPDDAAVVRIPEGKLAVHTVDFFRAFIDDPYIFGRVAANHSLGDVFAMGATAQSATALVTIPAGLERIQESTLRQMMTGAVEVLNDAGCALVGGHTGEGKELALGFAVNGHIDEQRVLRKGGLEPGQALIITKPVGTGALFAAHARARTKGRWIDAALNSMQVSNRIAAEILHEAGSTACTDITGFGLLGHLVEMTRPSGVDATLDLNAIPWLEGAVDCVGMGITSSLQPANVRLRRAIRNQQAVVDDPRYPLLFDPQTAGGLLASVPEGAVEDCLRKLKAAGYHASAKVGAVLPQSDELSPIVIER